MNKGAKGYGNMTGGKKTYAGYGGGSSSSKPKTTPKKTKRVEKKGDIAELRRLLNLMISNTKNQKKLKDVVRRVIAFMTLGIDVSTLFTEMCMLSFTKDIITKKMIYLYLTNYAENNAELAIMAINSFVRDIEHSKDYKIKGLALRSLCSLRFDGIIDHAGRHALERLNDDDPYVKKAAINGCIKLYFVANKFAEENSLIDTLYDMIKDPSPLVVLSALNGLDEIMRDEGGIALNNQIVFYLINRLKDFDQFGQAIILELVHKHDPEDEDEMFGIMNNIEELLKDSSPCVILAVVKIFLKYFEYESGIVDLVMKKIRGPLLTLLANGEKESRFVIVSHLRNLINRGASTYFENDYKSFYCLADDPHYIQEIKLEILVKLGNEKNIVDILNELAEYANDIDQFLSKKTIRTLGQLGCRFPKKNSFIIKQLGSFLKMKKSHLLDEVAIAFSLILSKNSNKIQEISEHIEDLLETAKSEEAKISLIIMLGEFGNQIEAAPYLLEDLVKEVFGGEQHDEDNDNAESAYNSKLKINLITACVKLFTRRPAEMHPGLCTMFNAIINNREEDCDVLDRAGYYYSLLKNNFEKLREIFEEMRYSKADDENVEVIDTTLQFNSLSVIYRKPGEAFIKSYEYLRFQRNKDSMNFQDIIDQQNKAKKGGASTQAAPTDQTDAAPQDGENREEDLLGNGEEGTAPVEAEEEQPDLTNHLDQEFPLEDGAFKEKWDEFTEVVIKKTITTSVELTEGDLENKMKTGHLYSVATGDMDGEIRLYLYARYEAQLLVLVELSVLKADGSSTLTVKSENEDFSETVGNHIIKLLN